jgi:cytoskeletal protein RodZ
MSAPETNVEKQKKQHKPALMGIRGAVLFALVLLLGLIGWVASQGQTPIDPEVKIDGRTGDEVVVE